MCTRVYVRVPVVARGRWAIGRTNTRRRTSTWVARRPLSGVRRVHLRGYPYGPPGGRRDLSSMRFPIHVSFRVVGMSPAPPVPLNLSTYHHDPLGSSTGLYSYRSVPGEVCLRVSHRTSRTPSSQPDTPRHVGPRENETRKTGPAQVKGTKCRK